MVSATPCACDGSNMLTQSYENYDIPKTITQDAMQFYDTPRNLLIENAPVQQQLVGPYANYDMPQQPLPVYRKPCGCIMKLIKLESKYSTKCVYILPLVH